MSNDWNAMAAEFHDIMDLVKNIRKVHGEDGKDVAIELLAIRLARRRAGIDEEIPYGENPV